ncbi:MAG: class II fructose-bisphosphatase [Chloroflexi bacterium]|nr:class II fructose-bisphosphatase [Chloroflexota bacterium]
MAQLDRNLAMELVRVTESAALAAARWMGRGDKVRADQAAVDAMRLLLDSIALDGVVVIGEGEKDKAPMLFNGERIGMFAAQGPSERFGREVTFDVTKLPSVDIAVDPIDGTRLLSLGLPNALSVVAMAERGTMFSPGHLVYMDKLAVGPAARGLIDMRRSVRENLEAIAKAKNKNVSDLTAVVLDRPRNSNYVTDIRACGARLKLITDGDVAGAISTALEGTGVDVLFGSGGSPEAVIAACALKCLGGDMQCRLYPRDEAEKEYARQMGYSLEAVLAINDLVKGEEIYFAATGITDGELLRGVHYTSGGATTESLVMRSRSGTVRRISATHRLSKLRQVSQIEYGG